MIEALVVTRNWFCGVFLEYEYQKLKRGQWSLYTFCSVRLLQWCGCKASLSNARESPLLQLDCLFSETEQPIRKEGR